MRLPFLLYLYRLMLINVNIVPTQLVVIVIYVKHMVVAMLFPRVNLLVLKVWVNLPVFWAVITLSFFLQFAILFKLSNICISKNVRCSVSEKPVRALISSKPIKLFVTWKPVCFSNVIVAKKSNSFNTA